MGCMCGFYRCSRSRRYKIAVGGQTSRMKPLPAPNVPGDTEAERMDNAVKRLLAVPKEAYLKTTGSKAGGFGLRLKVA